MSLINTQRGDPSTDDAPYEEDDVEEDEDQRGAGQEPVGRAPPLIERTHTSMDQRHRPRNSSATPTRPDEGTAKTHSASSPGGSACPSCGVFKQRRNRHGALDGPPRVAPSGGGAPCPHALAPRRTGARGTSLWTASQRCSRPHWSSTWSWLPPPYCTTSPCRELPGLFAPFPLDSLRPAVEHLHRHARRAPRPR
jgi:hypothetical protein